MKNVSLGVATVSQTDNVSIIEDEYKAKGDSVKESIRDVVIDGNGTTMDDAS